MYYVFLVHTEVNPYLRVLSRDEWAALAPDDREAHRAVAGPFPTFREAHDAMTANPPGGCTAPPRPSSATRGRRLPPNRRPAG